MIKLSANKCLHYAEILDEYEFYEEADFYTKIANVKLAEVPYDPKRLPSWIKDPNLIERGIQTGFGKLYAPLEKSKAPSKLKETGFLAPLVSMDVMDLASTSKEALELKKIKKITDLVARNPNAAQKATGTLAKLSTVFPKLSKFLKFTPLIGVVVNLYMSRQDIAKYIDLIAQGKFDAIWNDAEERAKFIELVVMTIAGVLTSPMIAVPFPALGALGAALFAFSTASSIGRTGIEASMTLSGEKNRFTEEISETEFGSGQDIEELKKSVMTDVRLAAEDMEKYLNANPNVKNIDLIRIFENKYKFLKNPVSPGDQLKFSQWKNLMSNIRAQKFPIKKSLPQTATKTKPIDTSITEQSSNDKSMDLAKQNQRMTHYYKKINDPTTDKIKLKEYIEKKDPYLTPPQRQKLITYLNSF